MAAAAMASSPRFAIGNVAQVGRENRPSAVCNGVMQTQRDIRSVRANGLHLEAFSQHRALAGFEITSQAVPMPIALILRDDETGQFLSHSLVAGVTENAFRRGVELHDASIRVH